MNPRGNIFETVWRALDRQPCWCAWSLLALVLAGGLAAAQESDRPDPSDELAEANDLAPTNHLAETNTLSPLSALAQTNRPASTNLVAETSNLAARNAMAQTNAVAPTEGLAETNGSGQFAPLPSGNRAQASTGATLDYASFRIITERNIFDPNRSGRRPSRYENREPGRQARVDAFTLVGTMSYEKGQFAFFDGTSYEYRKALKPADMIAGYKIAEIAPKDVKLAASNGTVVNLPVGMQMRREDEGAWQVTERTDTYTVASASSGGSSDRSRGESSRGSFDRSRGSYDGGRGSEGSRGSSDNRFDRSRGSRDGASRESASRDSSFRSSAPDTSVASTPAGTNAEPAAAPTSSANEDEVLKRLMQKREEELNK